MVINWVFVIVPSKYGTQRATLSSGRSYVITNRGAPVREDDVDELYNTEVDVCCGKHAEPYKAKPFKKGLPPAGYVFPDPIIVEDKKRSVKKEEKEEVVTLDSSIMPEEEEQKENFTTDYPRKRKED